MSMSIDIRVVNTLALTLATVIGMVVMFALRRHIKFFWFTYSIEALLFSLLIRRLDVIGSWFGIDVISQDVNDFVISWAVIVTLYISFHKIWVRRKAIDEIEALHQRNAERLARHERRMAEMLPWSNDVQMFQSTENLNNEISQALK